MLSEPPDQPPQDPQPGTPWDAPAPRPAASHRWVFVAIMVVTLVVHLTRVSAPSKVLSPDHDQCKQVPPRSDTCFELIPLDERHYVPDARDVLAYGTESDTRIPDGEGESGAYVVHPPVGKWFIAAGIALFGDRPLGWRIFGAIFGVIGVALLYSMGRRLWSSPWYAAAAALLLAFEGMWFVMSRVAMLDIYAAVFMLGGFWALLHDRDAVSIRMRGPRRWQLAAGILFGLALASKWAVVPFLIVAGGVALAWETRKAIEALPDARWWRRALSLFATLIVLPLVVYTSTFVPWMMDEQRYVPPACEETVGRLPALACYHVEMVHFHQGLEKFEEKEQTDGTTKVVPVHPYYGEAYSWPWLGRPVAHAYDEAGSGPHRKVSHVLGLPNPVVWWIGFFFGIPALIFLTLRRDRVAAFLIAMILIGWVPYLIADTIHRPVFLFYATPMIPFLVLGLVHIGKRLFDWTAWSRWPALMVLVAAVTAFAFFYPVLAAYPIDREGTMGWDWRIWLADDCTVDDRIKLLCWI